jgi:UDP-glucose 4-epimerase
MEDQVYTTGGGADRGVLVWGALGFLGQYLVERLLSRGFAVSVLCRPRRHYPSPDWASKVRWFELTEGAENRAILSSAVQSASVIYDLAGLSGAATSNDRPLESLEANCRSQLEFLTSCESAGHRPHVVFPSSWLVYGLTEGLAVNERQPVAPRSMYAAHKLCIENYLQIYAARNKITYTICRISNPYGFDPSRPGGSYKVLNSFIQNALAGTPIRLFGDGRQLRDYIYISDLVDALMLCGYSPQARNEVLNISSGTSHSLLDAVETIRDLLGAAQVVFEPWPDHYMQVESGDYVADISKAASRLGFAAADGLRPGLAKTISLYRSQSDVRKSLTSGQLARAGRTGG